MSGGPSIRQRASVPLAFLTGATGPGLLRTWQAGAAHACEAVTVNDVLMLRHETTATGQRPDLIERM